MTAVSLRLLRMQRCLSAANRRATNWSVTRSIECEQPLDVSVEEGVSYPASTFRFGFTVTNGLPRRLLLFLSVLFDN